MNLKRRGFTCAGPETTAFFAVTEPSSALALGCGLRTSRRGNEADNVTAYIATDSGGIYAFERVDEGEYRGLHAFPAVARPTVAQQ